ncbi:Cytochrome C and Quinol oxidase polypeptide I [Bacillus sp. OV194]|uniref:cytochrome-c oxidase n=1 Tax=Fictibacillus sp. B-59209 TaxID=3024873 RepID=UPI0008E89576|nr:cytochrome-c oxidase [Fictibacillus sp. B-59209]MED2974711.1 cytochrome-c oxidase [Fictibacillus sp. B-59209]SFE95621.1 Cytochrome C and Quinol oxidase polypeptide I [Bacillus sp. OV194]
MGIRLIKISALYFVLGVGLGMFMSISHGFQLKSVHAHVNLLGWTALTLAGIIYHLFPEAAASRLGKIHFWLHNIGLPVMLLSLSFYVYGHEQAETFIAIGATITALGIVLFAVNIWKNVKA